MTARPVLSFSAATGAAAVDLDRLVASRALIQANSGGGKSRLLRQLLEETHGRVQQLVIDPEGEFASLRERFDYVLAAKHAGDVEAAPKTAKVLCRRLMEIGASAVLDLYELAVDDRRAFVRIFLEELMALPRTLWRPVLIVVDEAHLFAPERGSGESQSTAAVIDLCSRGRKRGFAAVLATQRISKLHKDAAAELLNRFIGRTGLDVDVKRAGDELGFDKEQRQTLPRLEAGEFYVYGPAVSPTVQLARSGKVTTSHPEAGRVGAAPPPAPAKVKAMLARLADLPQQAAEEARSIAELEQLVKQLRRDLRVAQSAAPAADPATIASRIQAAVQREVPRATAPLRKALEAAVNFIIKISTQNFDVAGVDRAELERAITAAVDRATQTIDQRLTARAKNVEQLRQQAQKIVSSLKGVLGEEDVVIAVDVAKNEPFTVSAPSRPASQPRTQAPKREPAEGVSNPQQRMLDALLSFEHLGLDRLAKSHVAVFSDQSSRSSGYRNNVSALAARGLLERVDSDTLRLTDAGRAIASADAAPASLEELHEAWLRKLPGPQRLMLSLLLAAYPKGIERDDLAKQAGQSPLSSGYRNNLSALNALGLITKREGEIVASDLLYPEGL